MKLSSIKVNGRAIEQGAWVDNIPQLPGVRLKVRGIGNNDYARLRAQLIREIPQELRLHGLDPADADAIDAQCLSETVLLDWSGIDDESWNAGGGAEPEIVPLPFDKALALQYLTDPDYLVFRNGVFHAASVVHQTKAETAKADAGN